MSGLQTCVSKHCKTEMENVAVFPVPDCALKNDNKRELVYSVNTNCNFAIIKNNMRDSKLFKETLNQTIA